MQQTETYKLNLIETSDTFSPAALNENAQKLEAALAAEVSARQETDDALTAQLATFEVRKIVVGSYGGQIYGFNIDLGFTPKAVFLQQKGRVDVSGIISAKGGSGGEIIENGFKVGGGGGASSLNGSGNGYVYIAFG